MGLKKIVLHIGSEKTGTTSIQEFLALNRKSLSSRGIYFPKTPGEKNHIRLTLAATAETRPFFRRASKQVMGADSVEAFRARVRKHLHDEVAEMGASTLVLSNEHMHPHLQSEEELRRLKDLLPLAEEISVIFYVRRQDQFALSLDSTGLKAGSLRERFVFPAAAEGRLPYRFDYLAAYRLWSSVFGDGAVRVRIFEREALLEGDLLRDFCAAAGIPWEADYSVPVVLNRSLDVNGEYVFRHFNKVKSEMGEALSPRVHMEVRNFLTRHFSGGVKPRPARADAVKFLEAFRDVNEELRRLACPQRQGPIFNEDFSDYPERDTSGEEAVDHSLICRTLLSAWLQEAGKKKAPAPRSAPGNRQSGVAQGVIHAMGRAMTRRKST